jgi:hypothetical protein
MAFAAMYSATGIEWCEPSEPGVFPATPATRDLTATLNHLPRRFRRMADNSRRVASSCAMAAALGHPDQCFFLEVLGIIHDAELEYQQTGVDGLAEYLEYLMIDLAAGPDMERFIGELLGFLVYSGEVELAKIVTQWARDVSTRPQASTLVRLLVNRTVDSDSDSPGHQVATSPRRSTAPPHQLAAFGELVTAA